MAHEIQVLDHGFVRLRNIAGPTRRIGVYVPDGGAPPDFQERNFDADDVDPANAARMSFDNMDMIRTEADDHKLARYLMKNRHTSPFEMILVWLEMKLPIFVARQFVRHRTVRLNEMSGRYVTLPREWYIPEVVGGKAKSAKQGQEDNLSPTSQHLFKCELNAHCERGYELYTDAIEAGVAPEHARMLLSLNHYTHWLWNQDLHNLMHFLSLRDHSHAQVEAQAYARAISELIRRQLPHSMALYDEFRKQA
jgi:thymidylate synthase (FAD)